MAMFPSEKCSSVIPESTAKASLDSQPLLSPIVIFSSPLGKISLMFDDVAKDKIAEATCIEHNS